MPSTKPASPTAGAAKPTAAKPVAAQPAAAKPTAAKPTAAKPAASTSSAVTAQVVAADQYDCRAKDIQGDVTSTSQTTNHDEMIVTTHPTFRADSLAPTDILWKKKDRKATKPHRNFIDTKLAAKTETSTQKTVCRGERIILRKTRIGDPFQSKPSENPEFDGLGGGVKNGGVYKKEAKGLEGSPDLLVEKERVQRRHDPTYQNHNNTSGWFINTALDLSTDAVDALLKRQCGVEDLVVFAKDRKALDGRLDIVKGSEVELQFKHVDLTRREPPRTPKCQVVTPPQKLNGEPDKHPLVRVERREQSLFGKGLLPETFEAKREDFNRTVVHLDKEWVGEKEEEIAQTPENKREGEAGKTPEERKEAKKAAEEKQAAADAQAYADAKHPKPQLSREDVYHAGQAAGDAPDNARLEAARAEDRANEAKRKASVEKAVARRKALKERFETGKKVTAVASKLANVIKAFNPKPVEIRSEVIACAGSQVTTVNIYPAGVVSINFLELDYVKELVERLQSVLKPLETWLSKIEGIGVGLNFLERHADESKLLTLNIFISPVCAFYFEFRELTRESKPADGETPGLKPNRVGRAVGIQLGFETLVGIELRYSFPLARCVGPIGELAQRLLKLVKVEISVDFLINVGVGGIMSVEYNEYGKTDLYFETTLAAILFVGLVAKAGDFASATVGVQLSYTTKLTVGKATEESTFKLEAGEIRFDFIAKAKLNLFGIELEKDYSQNMVDAVIAAQKLFGI
ncbi:MAG: hypothetical protein U0271_06655 [Polyangiaceae bacterium]